MYTEPDDCDDEFPDVTDDREPELPASTFPSAPPIPITVERLNVCCTRSPGIGKTSLAFTADNPLLLDFDQGAHRAPNRKDIVRSPVGRRRGITADDLSCYNTVIVDTAGRALDASCPPTSSAAIRRWAAAVR
jgi:hypothetical protein